jgi:hypothetical protein
MGTPHKHRDVIIAWANGEECEFFSPISEKWETLNPNAVPAFYEDYEYRIKPKRVKKEGWVAVYGGDFTSERIHQTRAECVAKCPNAIVYIRIEWEGEI